MPASGTWSDVLAGFFANFVWWSGFRTVALKLSSRTKHFIPTAVGIQVAISGLTDYGLTDSSVE